MDLIKRVKFWFENLKPDVFDNTMKKEKSKASLREAFINLALSSVPYALLMVIMALLLIVQGSWIETLLVLILAFAFVVLIPIGVFIGQGFYWVVARLFGGQGSFTEQTYFMSYPESAFNLISVFTLIPCLGYLVSLVIGIYSLYLQYRATKQVHGLSSLRSAAVVLSPIILVIFVVIIAIMISLMNANSSSLLV